jgi:hypothetical protein
MNNKLKTVDDALEYVQNDGMNLKDVPESLRTNDVCLEAVKAEYSGNDVWEIFNYIPEEVLTESLCMDACDRYENRFEGVPEKYKTKALCLHVLELVCDEKQEDIGSYICDVPVGYWKDGDFCNSLADMLDNIDVLDEYITSKKIRADI